MRVVAGDHEHDVGDPELLERLSRAAGEKIQLLQVGRGTCDSMPVWHEADVAASSALVRFLVVTGPGAVQQLHHHQGHDRDHG